MANHVLSHGLSQTVALTLIVRTIPLTQDLFPTKIIIANIVQHFLLARPCPKHFKCVNSFGILGQVKAEGQDSFQDPSWLLMTNDLQTGWPDRSQTVVLQLKCIILKIWRF